MDIFGVISLLGGLAMFLYGMRLMGDALKENSSGTLKRVMGKVTDNPVKAFLLGVLVTALIQSSTATIVITAGLVSAGILTLHQSLGIIVGANVGTTVTGQIIRLLDIDASGTSFLRFLQPSTLAPIALIVGILLIMGNFFKNSKSIGNIAIGFGILFSGLLNMTGAVNSLQESLESETYYSIADGDPNIELEKELISKKIPESAAFKEVINHLAAVIDYIDNTQLDDRTNMLLDIELLKARRQLFVQMRERRIGLIDTYAQYAKR